MTHAMVKGSNIPLNATAVRALLSWRDGAGMPDIDASALLLGADGRVRSDEDFVFYNQPQHPSGSVRYRAEEHGPDGFSEAVDVDLASLDASVQRVIVAASVDLGCFGLDSGLCLTIHDLTAEASAEPIASFDVTPDTGEETALICGELYRRGDGWKFRALGQGYASGLLGLATDFGISVDDDAAPPQPPEPMPEPLPQPAPVATDSETVQVVPAQPGPAMVDGTQTQPLPPGYGYPQPQPAPGGYGYPQPQPAPQQGYGYPQPQPPGGYGYPQPPVPGGYGYPPPQPAPQQGYGYPPAAPPTAGQGTLPLPPGGYPGQPAPQPAGPAPAAAATDARFKMPPQGPQFQSDR